MKTETRFDEKTLYYPDYNIFELWVQRWII